MGAPRKKRKKGDRVRRYQVGEIYIVGEGRRPENQRGVHMVKRYISTHRAKWRGDKARHHSIPFGGGMLLGAHDIAGPQTPNIRIVDTYLYHALEGEGRSIVILQTMVVVKTKKTGGHWNTEGGQIEHRSIWVWGIVGEG
jgi:hypothetical protein